MTTTEESLMSSHLRTLDPRPVAPSQGRLTPLGIERVRITGGFWADRQSVNAEAIIPHALRWETELGWIDNFAHTLHGDIAEHRQGREFADSDVYKLIEAMAWEVGRTGDPELETQIERLGAKVEAAQSADGYINTNFGNPGQPPRYSDFPGGHELYCFGHLIQAGVARLRTGRHDAVVRVALRAADHVCREFGPHGRPNICGHPEIEVALAELSRATGESRYVDQANLFIERRGHGLLPDIEFGRSYYQDDVPFREGSVLRGHAVRALYLCAAGIDVAVERGDDTLLAAARRQYDRTLATRTYLTGGMGSRHLDEAFGEDFELPPDRAYCETCAGVGSIMVAWRLLLATGEMAYGDIIERTLYNVLAASTAQTGRAFFYTNPLHRRTAVVEPPEDQVVPRADSMLRAPWFAVSCCPTNIARTFATLGGLLATSTDSGIQVHQYAPATIRTRDAQLRIDTEYPASGSVSITVQEASEPLTLDLRIPSWAEGATVDGVPAAPGRFRVPQVTAGQRIELRLPIEARVTTPHPRIDAIRGTVAVERGPLVLCVESVDLPDRLDVNSVQLCTPVALHTSPDGEVSARGTRLDDPDQAWPYGADHGKPNAAAATIDIRLSPYHSWGNRGPATVRVWLPTEQPGR